ncbi:MAG TPA: signal peptidase I [Candidatus Onthousia excrementipullorum]|uniref:Signal peptidase I n=1 Tax=Candidatus Onthousia excrementipullorum TaxID=2840884 RepID=A0A9D1DUS6_9FIRM|nr:signal peptidase I [Candidatus Onthousia excrementipullorum]
MKKFDKEWLIKLRKILHFITTVLMYSVCLIMIIVFLVFVVNFIDKQYNLKSGKNKKDLFSAYTIVSPSMVPSINVLDVVVTMRVNSPEDLKKGNIITFNSTDYRYSGVLVTHRIVDIEKTTSGEYLYTTKGDNNNTQDSSRIGFDEIYGRVLFRIPKIGYIQYYLSSILGWVAIIIVPAIMIIGYDIYKLVKTLRNGDDKVKKDVIKKEANKKKKKEGRFKK